MNHNNNNYLFNEMPVKKAVLTMAVPTIIGQLIVLIYSIADTFFIGRTNNPSMVAAVSLILPIFNIALPIASIAGIGGGSLISRLLGEDQKAEIRKVSSFCIYFSLFLGLLFSLFVLFYMKPLLILLGADSSTLDYAMDYTTCVIVIGGIPTILSNVLSNLIRSIGESSKAGFGITMGGIINIILDPLFMFVILPTGKESLGAGIATCISNFITCLYFIIIIIRLGSDSVIKLQPPGNIPAPSSIKMIFSVGVPSAIATFLFDFDYIVINKLMSAYGTESLAAIGIVLKAERLPLNIGIGICQGMVPLVAYNYSSHNFKRMNKVSNFSLLSGIVCSVISIIIYELFAPQLIGCFIKDSLTVSYGTNFIRIRCLATLFMFMSFYHVHLFNSYGSGKTALFLGVMRWAVFNIPMLFILNHFIGMYGLVWSQLIADILTVILSFIVHIKFIKKNKILNNTRN